MSLAHTLPLQGWQLIEASAGTGKTWTLSGLYLRLLAEREWRVDEILVMTFTRAATAELRERLRDGIANLLRAAVGDSADDVAEPPRTALDDDGFCALWLAQHHIRPGSAPAYALAQRLAQALRDFDQAQIFTLHGFCQRALEGSAFSGALPFERELINEPQALLYRVVADFWRLEVATLANPYLVQALHQQYRNPAGLARALRPQLARGNAQVRGGEEEKTAEEKSKELWSDPNLKVLRTCVAATHAHIPAAIAAAKRAGVLSPHKYKSHDLSQWIQQLQDFAASETAWEALLFGSKTARDAARKVLERFSAASLGEHAGALGQAIDDFLVSAEQFSAGLQQQVQAFTRRAWEYARAQVAQRLRASHEQTFDGLISDLHQALHGPNGAALAHSLRRRLPVALIDECQDTDPLQFEILRALYPDREAGCVVWVGDPKQAIYQFRGADLFAYLAMRAHIAPRQQHSLTQNQRSVPGLLQAWNALLGAVAQPFQRDDLPYASATAAPRRKTVPGLHVPPEVAPCEVLWLESEEVPLSKTQAQQQLAEACANEIALWLRRGYAQPAHVAVLVNTHHQGEVMRAALARHGVRAALRSRDSVYQSAEAPLLALALHAVLYPQRSAQLRAALLSDWWQMSAAELLEPEKIAAHLPRLAHWQNVWRKQGVMALVHGLLREAKISGERRITNLLHLAELLSQQENFAAPHTALAPPALLRFLQSAVEAGADGISDHEDAQLRLESDAALVQMVTVHASKGLEWPVVFVPFALLSSESLLQAPILVHELVEAQHRAVLDFAPNAAVLQAAQQEAFEEKLRSAYVALTRASHYCVLGAGAIKDAATSPLGYWLLQGLPTTPLLSALQAWQARAAGAVRVRAPEPTQHHDRADLSTTADSAGIAPTTLFTQPPAWYLSSFTALNAAAQFEQADDEHADDEHADDEQADDEHADDEHADDVQADDEQTDDAPLELAAPHAASALIDSASLASTSADPLPLRFRFRRGAAAGIALHHEFESLDWSAPTQHWRFNAEQTAWFDEIRRTPLPPLHDSVEAWSLSQVPRAQTQREMNFFMPLQHAPLARLSELAAPYGYAVPRFQDLAYSGFLTGSLDLVCWQQGRAYLVDYKSNWLGASFADYAPAALERAMREHGYHAQHLLYLTALDRWLSKALPGYHYEQHIGGVYYLFVRGMAPSHPGCGVYATRPAHALISAISQLTHPDEFTALKARN